MTKYTRPTKIRISEKGVFSKTFPPHIAKVIKSVAKSLYSGDIKSIMVKDVPSEYKFFVGEGTKYTGISSDGVTASFESIGEHNMGSANTTHKLNNKFNMPNGSYLVEISYLGGYRMWVYRIGDFKLKLTDTKVKLSKGNTINYKAGLLKKIDNLAGLKPYRYLVATPNNERYSAVRFERVKPNKLNPNEVIIDFQG